MNNSKKRREAIQENYARVVEKIKRVAIANGRNPDDIRLVVVTKTHPAEVIQAVIEAGAADLGENYVEEAIPKIAKIGNVPQINWHMIGHIQRRKAKEVCEYFQFVHSVDSLRLAEKLNRFLFDGGKKMPVWLEFNTGGEQTKAGWDISHKESWKAILPEVQKILELPGLACLGVMTIPPFSPNPEESRPYYRKLKDFQEFIKMNIHGYGFNELSMGMSVDYEIAIQEGSTCLRIGQAILGPRIQ